MIINVRQTSENATPEAVQALDKIRAAGGGELHFETGEYHFYKDGTEKGFFAVSNNSACIKSMVFPITDMANVVIDGHGSVFVFHQVVFPFMVSVILLRLSASLPVREPGMSVGIEAEVFVENDFSSAVCPAA